MRLGNIHNSYAAAETANQKTWGFDPSNYAQKISFQGSLMELTQKGVKFHNINKVMPAIDRILGQKNYMSHAVSKAGLRVENNTLILKNHTLLNDILSTIKYPFVDMPFDILNALSKGLKKTPLASLGNKITGSSFVRRGIKRVEAKKSYELVENILEKFCEKNTEDINKLSSIFSKDTTEKITITAKNYASRDERTLNRFVTGSIGALLSGVDMYNISMFEKNDKKAASKAQKDRKEQEMMRIVLSSGLTFLSLGALSRYTKNSVLLNAFVIAGSTLVAEIFSRVKKHKPLVPLTPEQAKDYAKNHKAVKLEPSFSSVQLTMDRINKNDKSNLYKNFTKDKNTYTQNITDTNTEKPPKKNNSIIKKLGIAVLIANLIYVATRISKGDYERLAKQKNLYDINKDKVDKFISGELNNLERDLFNKIDIASEEKVKSVVNKISQASEEEIESVKFTGKKLKDILNPHTLLEKIRHMATDTKKKITKRKVDVDIDKINQELINLAKNGEAKDIAPIVKKYQHHLAIIKADNKGQSVYTDRVERTVLGAIYAGVTKLFKTFYTILSAPAMLVDKIRFGNTEKVYKDIEKMRGYNNNKRFVDDYKKEIMELRRLFIKYTDTEDKYQKVAEKIRNHTRNFEPGSETSELANLSRTLVTLISSYFYVNDFRNTVLIESEGKNKQRAREVMNDSIGFKICNLFFNGTIMNLGNSLFKDILNRSLIGATAIAAGEEVTNEFLIRRTISRPMKKMDSKEDLIEYEQQRTDRTGPFGLWTRFFKKVTGQKSLIEKCESQKANK